MTMGSATAVYAGALILAAAMMPEASAQRVWTSNAKVVRQTADSAVVVAKCWTTGADSVRFAWTYPGVTRSVTVRASSCVDTLRVAKGAAAQTASVAMTPKKGATSGAVKNLSATVAARVVVVAPPVIDSAKIDTAGSVVTPPVVTPPVVPSAFTPNLPAGLTKYGETNFEPGDVAVYPVFTAPSGLFSTTYPEYGAQRQATLAGQPAGHGTGAWEIWHKGDSRGDGYGPGNLVETTTRNYKRLYVAMSLYFPPGYRAHSLGEKLIYLRTTTNGAASTAATVNFGPEDVRDETPITTLAQVATEPMLPGVWMPGHPVYGPYGRPWNATAVRMTRGAWMLVEVDFLANRPGQSDGHIKLWVDGRLCLDETGIRFADSGQTTFDALFFDFSKGGGASAFPTPPEGQSYYFGRLAWYGAR